MSGKQRTTFAKLEKERARRAKQEAKRARRQGREIEGVEGPAISSPLTATLDSDIDLDAPEPAAEAAPGDLRSVERSSP